VPLLLRLMAAPVPLEGKSVIAKNVRDLNIIGCCVCVRYMEVLQKSELDSVSLCKITNVGVMKCTRDGLCARC